MTTKTICQGTINSRFGIHTDPHRKMIIEHRGLDILCPRGTVVYSPIDGWVKDIHQHPIAGRTMIIGSECGNLRFGFCHLSSMLVAVGDRVAKGSPIARSGNTGRTLEPHLHVSLKTGGHWHDNLYVGGLFSDPEPFL